MHHSRTLSKAHRAGAGRRTGKEIRIKAAIARGIHLFPSRTEKLSPAAPMVLRKWESRSPPHKKPGQDASRCPGFPFSPISQIGPIGGQSENTVANKYSGGCGAAILGLTACGASDGRETCGQEWQTYQIGFGDAALTPSVSCSASPKPCLCGAVCPRVSLPDGRSTPRLSIVRQLRCRFLGLTRMIEDGKIDHIRHVCP